MNIDNINQITRNIIDASYNQKNQNIHILIDTLKEIIKRERKKHV